jgi:hypothetical protein
MHTPVGEPLGLQAQRKYGINYGHTPVGEPSGLQALRKKIATKSKS